MTLYEELKAAGCEVANHESDLYVKADATAIEIVRRHQKEDATIYSKPFRNEVTGETWLDIAFRYDPWWAARAQSAQ